MTRFVSKPRYLDAVQWLGYNHRKVERFMRLHGANAETISKLDVDEKERTLRFWCSASKAIVTIQPNDWVAVEPDGLGFYPLTAQAARSGWEQVDA